MSDPAPTTSSQFLRAIGLSVLDVDKSRAHLREILEQILVGGGYVSQEAADAVCAQFAPTLRAALIDAKLAGHAETETKMTAEMERLHAALRVLQFGGAPDPKDPP